MWKMRCNAALVFIAAIACLMMLVEVEGKGGLQIGVKERPDTCDQRTKKGDRLSMHYTVCKYLSTRPLAVDITCAKL